MSLLIIVILVVIAAAALAVLAKTQGGGTGKVAYPYQQAKALFSPAERSFLGVLDQSVGPEYRVFGKVRVADVATVKTGLTNSARQGALNKIASKHFDFVVCRATDFSILCAIELNDKSHSSQRAQARDELLDKICQTINLPLIQVPAKQSYSTQDLRAQFLAAISSAQTTTNVGT